MSTINYDFLLPSDDNKDSYIIFTGSNSESAKIAMKMYTNPEECKLNEGTSAMFQNFKPENGELKHVFVPETDVILELTKYPIVLIHDTFDKAMIMNNGSYKCVPRRKYPIYDVIVCHVRLSYVKPIYDGLQKLFNIALAVNAAVLSGLVLYTMSK